MSAVLVCLLLVTFREGVLFWGVEGELRSRLLVDMRTSSSKADVRSIALFVVVVGGSAIVVVVSVVVGGDDIGAVRWMKVVTSWDIVLWSLVSSELRWLTVFSNVATVSVS